MSKARRFARNVTWSAAGQIVVAAANFLFIPYLVRGMGQADYGLYILMHTVSSYLLLLTFGASPTTVKFVAEFVGAKNARALDDALGFSLAAHLIGVLPGAAALFFFARPFAVHIFRVPEASAPLAVAALRGAAIGAVAASLVQFASGVLQGLQRFDFNNALIGAQNGLMPFGAAAAVFFGLGLTGAASWYVVLNALSALAGLSACWLLLRPTRSFGEGRGLKPSAFADYGASMWLTLVGWVVAFQCDKIFLARGTSLSDLTLYSVPAGLMQRVQVLGPMVSNVLLPMMSELHGPDAHETLVRMYLKASRFLLWAVLPALVLLFILMPQFLGLWLGGEFAGRGVWPARFLVLAALCFLLNSIPNAVACSRGRPWAMTVMIWAQAVASVLGWKLLIPRLGITGAALGSLSAQVLSTAAYLIWLHSKLLRLGEWQFLRRAAAAPIASAAILAALVYPAHAFVDDWPKLFAFVAAGLALYYGSVWLLLDVEDKRLLAALLKREPVQATGV